MTPYNIKALECLLQKLLQNGLIDLSKLANIERMKRFAKIGRIILLLSHKPDRQLGTVQCCGLHNYNGHCLNNDIMYT